MNKSTGKVGCFTIKVDLAEAYDMLSWNFMHENIIEVAFPMEIINVIMAYVKTRRTNVRWNDARAYLFSFPKERFQTWRSHFTLLVCHMYG